MGLLGSPAVAAISVVGVTLKVARPAVFRGQTEGSLGSFRFGRGAGATLLYSIRSGIVNHFKSLRKFPDSINPLGAGSDQASSLRLNSASLERTERTSTLTRNSPHSFG
jgi:hypothetical protein